MTDSNRCEKETVRMQDNCLVPSPLLLKVIPLFAFVLIQSVDWTSTSWEIDNSLWTRKDGAWVFYHHPGGILDSAASTGGIKSSAQSVLVFFYFFYFILWIDSLCRFSFSSVQLFWIPGMPCVWFCFRSLFKSLNNSLPNLHSSWLIFNLYWLFFLSFRR